MGSHWRPWLAAHREPGFIPAHLFRHVEVTDTPHETAQRVAERLAAAGADRAAGARP
jgi:hypothetical protein